MPVVLITRWLLQGHRLGATAPQRVDHGLDVLLVHHQLVGGDLALLHGAVDLVLGRVAEHHRDRRAVHRLEPGRATQLVDLLLEVADLGVVDVLAELVHLLGQRGDLLLLRVGTLPLLAYDGVQVGHAGGPEVEPAGVDRTGDEETSGHHEHHDRDDPPGVPPLEAEATPRRARRFARGVAQRGAFGGVDIA